MQDEVDGRLRKTMLFLAVGDHGYSYHDVGAEDILVSGPNCEVSVSMARLRQLTINEPTGEWFAIISDYLSTLLATAAVERESPLDVTDFGSMRGLIRTRTYVVGEDDDEWVCWPIAPGLVQRLLIDHVHTVESVRRRWVTHWPMSDAGLFDLADDNVRADGDAHVAAVSFDGEPMAEGLAISRLTGPEYLTAHLGWLDAYPVVGSAGALITIPSKTVMYCYPINDVDALRAALILARLGQLMYLDDEWPVSPWLYHWHDGTLDLAAITTRTSGVGGRKLCSAAAVRSSSSAIIRALISALDRADHLWDTCDIS